MQLPGPGTENRRQEHPALHFLEHGASPATIQTPVERAGLMEGGDRV